MEELLAERDHVLVALNGSIAEVPSPRSVASRLRELLAEDRLPRKVARTDDPLVVLAHARVIGPATERAVYAQWRRIEHEVVAGAEVVPGVRDAFAALAAGGVRITVIGTLDVEVIRTLLLLHGLDTHVDRLTGRTEPHRALPLPASDLIDSAVHAGAVPARLCAFVGSSTPDLAAARAAGVDTIRYRRDPALSTWFDALSG